MIYNNTRNLKINKNNIFIWVWIDCYIKLDYQVLVTNEAFSNTKSFAHQIYINLKDVIIILSK